MSEWHIPGEDSDSTDLVTSPPEPLQTGRWEQWSNLAYVPTPVAAKQGDFLTVYHNPMLGVKEEQFSNKVVGFMWGLHSYKKRENVWCRQKITYVRTLTMSVQVLWEAEAKMEIGVRELYGGKFPWSQRGEGTGAGRGLRRVQCCSDTSETREKMKEIE